VRGEPGDRPITDAILVVANHSCSYDSYNSQRRQPEGRGVSNVMLSAAMGDLLGSKDIAVAFTL